MALTRRNFLAGCSAAIAALAGGRLTKMAFANPYRQLTDEVLVVIFLRGGMDGLSLVAPYNDQNYNDLRPNIRLPAPGSGANAALDLDGQFGCHALAAPLRDLYQQQKLAVVHACGLTSDTRSHFDAMDYMERGTPGSRSMASGWLTRHLVSGGASGALPAIAASSLLPASFLSSTQAVAMTDPDDFGLDGHWRWTDGQRLAMRHLYNGDSWLHQAGEQALNALDIIEVANPGAYVPEFGAVYPTNSFGTALMTIAQMIKLDVGLTVAAADYGGWDTHEYQGDAGAGYFAGQIQTLANGMAALYTDLTNYTQRVTIAVMSEFGRRLRENGNRGTDHGHGNVMLLLGGHVNGGQVYAAPWPGLDPANLDNGTDLAITTDYRRILSEILVRRMGNPNLGEIFPGYLNYTPLGVVQGPDLPINFGPTHVEQMQNAVNCFANGDVSGACATYDLNNDGQMTVADLQIMADRWTMTP